MATITVTTPELHARLDELLAAARSGAEVLVQDTGVTPVKLAADPQPQERRTIVFDMHPGGFVADDFAAPLPDDFWEHSR